MQKFGVNELRRMFLEFFESKEHLAMKSFSLVPHNDNSLLLINSGMPVFKIRMTKGSFPKFIKCRRLIVFIDEGNEFIKTVEFADTIQKTDNYYVIVSRESLPSLPYSVEEIYGIRTSGKYGTLKPCYHEFYRIYGAQTLKKDIKPEVVITEDSNSGYQFSE